MQLWDQGRQVNPQATFQPLFTRNVSACIVMAKTSNKRSLEKAHMWKEYFERKTRGRGEPVIPCTLFVNHDDIIDESAESLPTSASNETYQRCRSVRRPIKRVSFGPGVAHTSDVKSEAVGAKASVRSPSIGDAGLLSLDEGSGIPVEKILAVERMARLDRYGFFGVYHVSTRKPETIHKAFENLILRMLEEEDIVKREYSLASGFLEDYTIKQQLKDSNSDASQHQDNLLGSFTSLNNNYELEMKHYKDAAAEKKLRNRYARYAMDDTADYSFKLKEREANRREW